VRTGEPSSPRNGPRIGPYKGLHPYLAADAAWFFGRSGESHELLARWLTHRLTVVHGPVGVGKTSLLCAGAVPSAVNDQARLLSPARLAAPAVAPPVQSVDTGNLFISQLVSAWFPGGFPAGNAAQLSAAELLRAHPQVAGSGSGGGPVLLAIDQFEVLFAPDGPRAEPRRRQMIEFLGAAMASQSDLRLLVVLRSGYRADLAPHEDLLSAGSSVARVAVSPLDRSSAVAALREPARQAGRPFAPGAAEALIDDLCVCNATDRARNAVTFVTGEVQPAHLQIVATALADPAGPSTALDPPGPGGSDGLVDRELGEYLRRALSAVALEHRIDERELRAWFTRTFVTERGRRGLVDEGLHHTQGVPNAALHELEERHILASEWRAGSRWYQLAADRLIAPAQAAFPNWAVDGQLAAPENTSAADFLGAARSWLAAGDVEAAEAHAAEASQRAADRSRVHAGIEMFRGDLEAGRGRVEEAERRYRTAAAVYESLSDRAAAGHALALVGQLLLAAGRAGPAVEDLQAAVARRPGDAEVTALLARALWQSGQPWAALGIYSTVLTAAPDLAAARLARGQLRLELGEDVAALQDLDAGLRDNGASPGPAREAEPRAARAAALARLGRLEEAERDLAAALLAAPESGPVLLWAADVFRLAGDERQAVEMLRRAQGARNPALAPHQRHQLLRRLGQPGAMA
jgi:tetratricopeptide (TPR) repeat protein